MAIVIFDSRSKNTNNKETFHLKSFPSDSSYLSHLLLRLKILWFFLFYLKFLGFEFYFIQAWVNLDFYLIIHSLELTVRLKPDKASDTVEILCSFWFMDNEFALYSQSMV